MEKTEKQSVSDIFQSMIYPSPLAKYLKIKEYEVTTSFNLVKRYLIDGRVPKEDEEELNKLKLRILTEVDNIFGEINIDEFWKVTCGVIEYQKFPEIEGVNLEGNTIKIQTNSDIIIIDFWTTWSKLYTYVNKRKEDVKKFSSIKFYTFANDDNLLNWKKIIVENQWNDIFINLTNKEAFSVLGIKDVPYTAVIDHNGNLRYLGHPEYFSLEDNIENILNGHNLIIKETEGIDFIKNPNEWWIELDTETKMDIVKNINYSLKNLSAHRSTFFLKTQFVYHLGKLTHCTNPVFEGRIFEEEYEILQNLAIDLQHSLNLNNFQFSVTVITGINY